LRQLLADDVGIAERAVRALADDHCLFAHAARGQPLAQQLLGVAGAIDPAGIEEIAALLPEAVEHDGTRGEAAELLEAERDDRGPLGEPGNVALGNARSAARQRGAAQRTGAARGFLDL